MTLTMDQLIGLYPALVTPTDAAGTVDRAATSRLVEFLCAAGVNGLVPVGGTGEYAALTQAEHEASLTAFYNIFGDVMDTDMLIAALERGRAAKAA